MLTVKLLTIAIVNPPRVPENKNESMNRTDMSKIKLAHLFCSAFIFSIKKFAAVTKPMMISSIIHSLILRSILF